ncbi:hemagglutinin repeat-containing protein, partial [Delftia acidovorans]
WEGKNADGDIVTVEGLARSVPRLNTGSGSSTITLVGPDTGTIVGDAITINGGTITVRPGIDPATGLPLVVEARNREVKPGDVAKGPDGQAVKGDVKTGDAGKADAPREFKVLGGDPGSIGAGDTKGQGSDIKGPGDEGLPPRTSRPLDLSRPELATPEGGVAALLGGGKSVAWPDWKQMQIVPGGISANDLELNLNGQFINRGQLEVTNNLAIRAAEGIDNFGASIRAGGYTSLSGGGLDNRDGRIETGTLLTSLKGDIDNSRGSIVAHDGGYLQASGNIAATDGRFVSDAGKIVLDAGGNIDLVASKVEGKKGAGLYADGDIRLGATAKAESTHKKEDQILVTHHYDADNNLTDPEIRIKIGETQRRTDTLTHTGTTIDGGEGGVTLRAKGDVVALGSHIKAGEDVLVQGASVRVEALVDKSSSLEEEHRKNYDHALFQRSESLSGGEIEAGRNLSIVANGKADAGKGDITLKGATVTAKGDASLIASRDVNLQDMQTEHGRFEETYSKKSGFLSKKSTHTVEEGASSLSEGSVLGANNIYLQAGRDISVTGSHVVGQGDVGLVAGRDVQLLAGQDSAAATSHSETKKSGLFSGGGFGITLGSKSVTIDRSNESVRAAGSSVQAQGGNASIVAGNQYRQTGSAVLAQGDVNIVGKSVEINEARELERDKFEMRAKQSGLSVSISNPVVNVVQGGETVARIAGATGKTSDARMQALGAAAAGMAAYETYGKASQLIADPSSATSVGISLSLGKSSSRSTSEYQVNSAVGSLVKADGNVSITATQGDVHVRGSSVEAGKDVRLAADKGNIVLEAAENRFAEQNSQSSSSASVGVAFTLGSKNGFSVNVGLSQGKGSGSGESLSHTNTHIKAGGTASVQSGGDTTLKGATIVADTVKADIGGNLAIESLQDKSTYNEKSSSAGLNVSLCVPPLCYGPSSVGGSAGRTRIDSDYQSVVEQSGIRAGDGGFDVKVKGDTTLKGGAITSTQVAMDDGKNRFETGGKLTTSDIENHAAYDASGWSAGGSVGFQAGDQSTAKTEEQKKAALDTGKGLTGGSAGVGSDSGNASSTTKAGISGVAGDSGARTGDKETGLKPIFDKDKVRENVNAQIEITREFGKQGSAAWGNYATRQYAEALKNQDAEAAECWGPSGACRAVGHALIGGATGGVGGAAAGGFTSLTAPQAQALLRGAGLPEPVVDALVQGYALGAGAGIGGAPGAAAGANEASNNAVAPFAINVLLEGGALALAGCYALPACAKNIAPQMEQYLASLTKEQVASAVGQSWMRGCGLIPMCTLSLIAQGVDPRLLGVQGKPETPAPGPNHTGGDQTRNPNPGGGTTTTPNDGPKGGLGPNGKPIADPSDTTTVTPIPEPQGPQLVLSEKKNGGSVSALPGAAPGVNEIKGADALADNGFNVVHQPTNSSQNQPGRKADYYVEGIGQVDEYSPDPSTELPNMARAIEKKNKQGNGVMVQKDLTDYEIEILSNMVWKKPNAKNIDTLIFNSNGKLKVLKRPK